MKAIYDWSEERVRNAVRNSNTCKECLEKLGLTMKQGYNQFRRVIAKYNIDISHFRNLTNRTNNGITQTCSKCGVTKPLSEFYNRKRNKTGIMSICKTCCKSTYGRGRAKKEKLYWLQQYGGKCQHCGSEVNENNYVIFDFHHTNPSEKENNPNNIYRYGREIVKKELDKCIVLCANCHRLEHHRLKLQTNEER